MSGWDEHVEQAMRIANETPIHDQIRAEFERAERGQELLDALDFGLWEDEIGGEQ